MKAPHVEIQDFDNDGWPDIYTSIIKFERAEKGKLPVPHPVIFKNLGVKNGLPQFREDAWAVNDFPTPEDIKMQDVGAFFKKMEDEKKIVYMAPGPSADFDRDGRLDLFLPNWWVGSRSLLLRNETPGGNWLRVAVQGPKGVNRMGIGTLIRVFPAGQIGKAEDLLGAREISAGYGYASGQEAIAHFGLGDVKECDLEIVWPHGKGRFEKKGVRANQHLVITP
jgi:enediyne biosynthesis protein E4